MTQIKKKQHLEEVWQYQNPETGEWSIVWCDPVHFSTKFGLKVQLKYTWMSAEDHYQYLLIQSIIKSRKS